MADPSLQTLWGDGSVRAFISHVSTHKELAHSLKEQLRRLGVASFVAHDDIEPMTEWEHEIEKALFSMDVLLALLTPDFRNSKWTDQEVGVALGRGVRIVAFRLGTDPYGFMGKHQAFSVGSDPERMASEVFRLWLRDDDQRINAVDSFIRAVRDARSFAESNQLAPYLDCIPRLPQAHEYALVSAFNENPQAHFAWTLKGAMVNFLRRATSHEYGFDENHLRRISL